MTREVFGLDGFQALQGKNGGDPWRTDGTLAVAVLAVTSFSPEVATNSPAQP
jgi:hypothetical protein